MSERPPAKTAAERKRTQRHRMRQRGAPSSPAFDTALRDEAFALYQAGELNLQLPDLVQAAIARLTAAGEVTSAAAGTPCGPCSRRRRSGRGLVLQFDPNQIRKNLRSISTANEVACGRSVKAMSLNAKDKTSSSWPSTSTSRRRSPCPRAR